MNTTCAHFCTCVLFEGLRWVHANDGCQLRTLSTTSRTHTTSNSKTMESTVSQLLLSVVALTLPCLALPPMRFSWLFVLSLENCTLANVVLCQSELGIRRSSLMLFAQSRRLSFVASHLKRRRRLTSFAVPSFLDAALATIDSGRLDFRIHR